MTPAIAVDRLTKRYRERVAKIWNHRDDLGLMQQLGAPIYAGSHR
jgi:hypothetical protein